MKTAWFARVNVRGRWWVLCLFLAPSFAPAPPCTLAQTAGGSCIEVQECGVRFAMEVRVPALETGRVAEIQIAPNDVVVAGAPVARLDNRSLLIRRHAADLRLDSAKNDTFDNVEVRYAELALSEAEAELETSRSIQNDVLGAVPRSQVRKLKLAVERGQLEVALAKKRRKRAEIEIELREADLSVIDDQLRHLHAESPIDGVVLEVTRSAGEWIEMGETLATIGRMDRLHVHALLSSDAISPALCRELPVSVHWIDPVNGSERALRGKVLSVDPQMLHGGKFRLNAEIVNRPHDDSPNQWQLQPGVEVRMKVYISAATAHNTSRSHIR